MSIKFAIAAISLVGVSMNTVAVESATARSLFKPKTKHDHVYKPSHPTRPPIRVPSQGSLRR